MFSSLLGTTQASRLRHTLRDLAEVDDLLTRLRHRARVHTFAAHRAAVPRLRALVATNDLRRLGVTDAAGDRVDGYVAASDMDVVVSSLSLRPDPGGSVTLRVTTFDIERVRLLVATDLVSALDASTSTDPRLQGTGRRTLSELLESYR